MKFVQIWCKFRPICVQFVFSFANGRCIDAPCASSGNPNTLPRLQVPFHAWSPEVHHHGRKRFTPHYLVQVTGEGSQRGKGSRAGRAPGEARSERSEGSACSGRSAGDRIEASLGAGRGHGGGREVVIPRPSREDLGTAYVDAPPPPAPGHPGRQAATASRLGPTGGNGIFLPYGSWRWRPSGCIPTSAFPSPAPL